MTLLTNTEAYFDEIDLDATARARAREILRAYEQILGELPDHSLFISGGKLSSGIGDWGSLWILTDDYVAEAKSFISSNTIDWMFWKNTVSYWEVSYLNFDLETSSPDSQLTISVQVSYPGIAKLHAVGPNCEHLMRIIKSRIVPNGRSS